MDRSNPYFILSGFLSLSLFTMFISLFLLMILEKPRINNFALQKDNYISISLDTILIPSTKITNTPIVEEIKAKVVDKVEVKEIDIVDLFSDVWTKDIKIEKKKEKLVDNKRLELIQKMIQTSSENSIEKIEDIVVSDDIKQIDDENKKSSSANEVNEYLAKIQAIVYKYFYPPMNSEGHTVKAVIELSAYGKVLDFHVLVYSENQALNKECDKIKIRLLGALFPRNPKGISSKTILNIRSDK